MLDLIGALPGAASAHALGRAPCLGQAPAIRSATEADLDAITAIYAEQLQAGLGSWEAIVPDRAAMAGRLAAIRAAGLPWLVATDPAGSVLGFAHARPFRTLAAYRGTVEDCIHVAGTARGQGVGGYLLEELIRRCAVHGYRQMIAVIGDARNHASIALHGRHGFSVCGVLPQAGEKAGLPVDVVLMQRALPHAGIGGRA